MTTEIWTDGSCLGNPGPGGWAVLLRVDGADRQLSGGESASTNNRMELMAAIMAIEATAPGSKLVIHADSKYVGNGIQQWVHGWKRNGWRTAAKEPVKNVDLWQRLDAAASARSIEWRWVKGHADSVENNLVDRAARAAANGFA